LASDPHLDLRIPNIWYRLGIKWSAGKVVGASIPGMPGIVIGRNQDVAWAFTNSSVDNIDRIEIPKNSPEITVRREFIPIKGSPPMEVTLQLSPWGPIVDESEDKFTAIQWTALDPQNLKELDLSALNNAKNSQELLSAFEHWAGPPQNALFATRTGDIGWTLAGKLPKRTGFDGLSKIHRTPQTKWEGYVERSRFPVVINPPEGFIASANQRTVGIGKDLPLFGSHWPSPARAKRIRTLLQGKAKWNAVDCSQVQADNTSLTHLWYRDQVLTCPIDPSDPEHSLWLSPLYELIRNWNGTTSVDSSAFPVLRQFRYEIFLNLLSPISREISVIHEEILLDRISHDALVKKLWERKPRHLLSPSFSSYCSAFQKSLISAARQLVSEPSQLTTIRWGEMNRSEINHPLSRALPSFFQTVLNMPSTELAGDSLVPNVMTPRNGASMRLVMDLSDFKNSLFTQPGGQSGHPLSQHYNDLFSHWVKSEPVPFSSQHFSTQERFVPGATLGTRD
ncbi:MAG: penicillin acylase family protein, partial [Proteobacteria bacterium]|nr:penicillin acylase family protein [Pseudomonadota bacterium]